MLRELTPGEMAGEAFTHLLATITGEELPRPSVQGIVEDGHVRGSLPSIRPPILW
jgi:hypothetical protein